MLSTKLQKDLMNAYLAVHEEKTGHAAGASDAEKQASQLASDVRYKARGKAKPGASKEELRKLFTSILASSPAPNVVKAMASAKKGFPIINNVMNQITPDQSLTFRETCQRLTYNLCPKVKEINVSLNADVVYTGTYLPLSYEVIDEMGFKRQNVNFSLVSSNDILSIDPINNIKAIKEGKTTALPGILNSSHFLSPPVNKLRLAPK